MVDTNQPKIKEVLSRGVEEIIEKKSLLKKLKSGRKLIDKAIMLLFL